jgi:hypothetical protein
MLKRFFVIIILLGQGLLFSQNNNVSDINEKKLLYYFQQPGFLVPYIESELKKMTTSSINKKNDVERYFKEVESFNRLKEDSKLQSEMANIVWNKYNATSLINLELIDNKVNSEIINTIISYNYFLTIKTNTLGELIEFQFELFETNPLIDSDSKGNIRSGTLKKVKKIENFFINPKNPDYLKEIKNALYRLFDENNDPPIAIIEMYNKSYSKSFESFVSKGDTIEISGARSYDIDTEEISYKWKNIPVENQYYQHINKVNLLPTSPNQKIIISNDSIYYLSFNVSDGINDSRPINIKLIPTEKPKTITPLYQDFNSFDYLTGKSIPNNKDNEGRIYLDKEEVSKNKIIISKNKVGQKFIKNLHQKDTIGYTYNDSLDVSSIKFKSDFTETNEEGFLKKRQKKSYYLYQVNDNELLSDPVEFNHSYVRRGAFSIRTGLSATFLGDASNFQLISNDSLPLGSTSLLLEISADLSRKTRLSGFIDINFGKSVNLDGYNFSPQPEIGVAFEYFLLKRFSSNRRIYPFIGLEFGGTTFITDEEISNPSNNPEGSTNWIYTYAARAGMEYEFETRWFLFSPGFLFKYGLYNKDFLKNNHFSNMSFIFNFKF